jgi:hypothetical protein
MKGLLFGALVVVLGFAAPLSHEACAACPIGSYPWVDKWGTSVCKSFGSGQNTVTQGSLSDCPAGSHPWVDKWGTRICQSFDGGTPYYDTSKSCPTGTHNWVDKWGNQICKPF